MKGLVAILALSISIMCTQGRHIPGTARGHCLMDIIVLLDTSGSIRDDGGEKNWDAVKTFTTTMVGAIDDLSQVGTQTRIGITSYSNLIKRDIYLHDAMDQEQIDDFITGDDIEFQGSVTRMFAAVRNAHDQLEISARSDATSAVILFTDGVPNADDPSETLTNVVEELQVMMDKGIFVVMVGIHNVNDTMMESIENYVNTQGFQLGHVDRAISFGQLETSGFPNQVISHLDIKCNAPDPSPCGLDIFMLVDSSGSIGENSFMGNVRPFAQTMVDAINDRFNIDGGRTRMAVETFSRGATMHLNLTEGTDTDVIKERIARMVFDNSWTHVVQYSRLARDELLRYGRHNVELRLLIITDGVPTHEDENNREESVENLIDLITDMRSSEGASKPIFTSIVGFEGSRATHDIEDILEQLDGKADVVHIDKDYGGEFSVEASRAVAGQMGNNCPSQDDICSASPKVMGPTDLVIVVDETTEANFLESREIAQNIVTDLRAYITAARITVQVVSSSESTVVGDTDDVMDLITSRRQGGRNLLLQALTTAHIAVMRPPVLQIDPTFPRFRVVLVIHSGIINYDTDPMGEDSANSFKRVVYEQLKFNAKAQIHSLPLSTTNDQGYEVLQRLHTQGGSMVAENDNYLDYLRSACPKVDPCLDMDVAFLMDVSRSTDMASLKLHVLEALDYLKLAQVFAGADINVALVSYSEFANVHVDLENGKLRDDAAYNRMVAIINALERSPQTMTNTAYGLHVVSQMVFRNHGDRSDGTDHIIIFTDGETNMVNGAIYNTVAIGDAKAVVPSTITFKPLASKIMQGDYDETSFRFHTPSMMDDDDSDDFYRTVIRQQVANQRSCSKQDNNPIACSKDLMIVFDSSGSITDYGGGYYQKIREYIADLVTGYYVNNTGTGKMGVVYYSATAETYLPFTDYQTEHATVRESILDQNEMKHKGGQTNIEGALTHATIEIDRDSNNTVILLISDGEWNLFSSNPNTDDYIRTLNDPSSSTPYTIYGLLVGDRYLTLRNRIQAAITRDGDFVDRVRIVNSFGDLPTKENLDYVLRSVCQ